MGNKYKYFVMLLVVSLVVLLLSACVSEPKTETVVIADSNEVSSADQSSRPFQVQKIYRLPDRFANTGQLLGWTSGDAVIASFGAMTILKRGTLERLTYPYEQSKPIPGIGNVTSNTILSPDGKYICEVSPSSSETTLKLISLQDGKEKKIDRINTRNQSYVQYLSWSANSSYISYLVENPLDNGADSLYIYDMGSQTSDKYQLKGIIKEDTLLSVNISNDGRSVLLQLFRVKQGQKKVLTMGKVSGKNIEFQYERQIGGDSVAWMNNDQFVFLGTDNSLYEYDRRNGELSVILEKVFDFEFSPDRKNIAYTVYDQNVTYVGKVQGRNILYKEPVYRGIVPTHIYWNPNNKSVLLQGQKQLDSSQTASTDSPSKESLIIELK
ncbi:WD40 repeat domain-containing protein [Paenibacillus sp. SEL1]